MHTEHQGYSAHRVGGRDGAPVIAWFCHQCMTGAMDDATTTTTEVR
jgi:hypothetical protein